MMNDEKILSLPFLFSMGGDDIQTYVDKGGGNRYLLNEEISKYLQLSDLWSSEIIHQPNSEHDFPVHLKFTHKFFDSIAVDLLSSRGDVPFWSAYIEYSANCVAWVYTREFFEPSSIKEVLLHLHDLIIEGYSTKEDIIMILRKQGAAV